MSPELQEQIGRLKAILASVEFPFIAAAGASEEEIIEVEQRTGIEFDADLRSLWKFSNGAAKHGPPWFAVMTDELTGCDLASLKEGVEAWHWFENISELTHAEWFDDTPRDARIRPRALHHRGWFPIVEFNGFSTAAYFDADPSPSGNYGQIIAYQHDPDAIYYVADNLLQFFKESNDQLESNLTQLLFMADEYQRICHMKGTTELVRQLKVGLDPQVKNWRGWDLRKMAVEKQRQDIVAYLDEMKIA
jgi:cell wall assembly regulator SMI1